MASLSILADPLLELLSSFEEYQPAPLQKEPASQGLILQKYTRYKAQALHELGL